MSLLNPPLSSDGTKNQKGEREDESHAGSIPGFGFHVCNYRPKSRGSQPHLQVPQRLLKLLAALREYLQHRAALPVLLSDRRLAKATRLLQIAAFTCGGVEVSEVDLLLLQHVFWDRDPEQGEQVREWLLVNFSSNGEEEALAVAQKSLNRIRDKLSGAGRFPGVRRAIRLCISPSQTWENRGSRSKG